MKRRVFLTNTAAAGAVMAASGVADLVGRNAQAFEGKAGRATSADPYRLTPPATGKIPVAFAISDGVTVIDFCGPWEVFQDVNIPTRGKDDDEHSPFQLFTVSEKTEPLRGSAGLQLVPDYTFENAPTPKVVVVPAQRGSKALHEWLRKVEPTNDLTMSVCTGAFQLARAGLLSGKSATTHHDFLDSLAKQYPDINVKRGLRFVDSSDRISTAGGLTSGIDLALRVVARYFGREAAQKTAAYMEYQSKGWVA
jgi:transcriptional regulator GlxA family with amidase domain